MKKKTGRADLCGGNNFVFNALLWAYLESVHLRIEEVIVNRHVGQQIVRFS